MATAEVMNLLKRQTGVANPNNDQNVGSHTSTSSSLSGLLSTLIPTLLIALVYFVIFLFLRRKYPRNYAPRTYMGSLRKQERSPQLPGSWLGWMKPFNKIPDEYVLQHNSLDGYFLLRYLKMAIVICLVGCCITWPILFPVDATGGGGQKQLDILSFTNIAGKNRYYAHVFVSYVFIGFVYFLVTRESIYYINLRQAYLLSPLYAARMSSRTVLFQSVPKEYTDERKIRRMFGNKLKNVWIASDAKKLEKLVEERHKLALKLEGGETKLIKLANDARLKAAKKGGSHTEQAYNDVEAGGESGSLASRWVPEKKRPTHRTGFLGLIGKKVDTVNYGRSEIARLNPLIEREQNIYRAGEAKPMNGVFVEFFDQTEAQAAFQMVAHHQPLHMSPRYVGMVPQEIIWKNLNITWKTRAIRNILAIAAVVITIIFWSIPVAVVGGISQINYLEQTWPWLSFINKCPTVILGVITNLLPTILLAVLMSLLPPYLRFLGTFAGEPTLSAVELRCHESYFWFQVIQVFLVTTFTSAASAAVPSILKNPSSVTSLLAENLPKASNFYISYFILQGLTFSSGALLGIVGFLLFNILGKVLDKTPRKMYNRWANLSRVTWGTIFPVVELLVVISITYAGIAPLMLGFALIGLCLFYFAYRYNLLFVNASLVDTKGLVYAKALQHTTVGCYLGVICLIGLFGIRGAVGPIILEVLFLIVMVLYHISLNSAINPLLYYLPRSLEAEEDALLLSEDGIPNTHANGVNGNGLNGAFRNDKTILTKNGYDAPTMDAAPHKVSMFKKFFRPDVYCNYPTLRRLVPTEFADISYSPEIERDAYQHPAVKDSTPLLWVPRDQMGVSRQEVMHTNKVTPMTDEGAMFNEKGKIIWSEEETGGRAPIWEEKIYY